MILCRPIWEKARIRKDPTLAFVLMPFQPKWSNYIHKNYISRVASKCGLIAKRADDLYGRNVIDDIWKGIFSARLLIAEVTIPNPNVYYELGIAHTLGKPVILLTQDISSLPFDLRTHRCIVYSDDHDGYQILISELGKHLKEVLAEPVDEIHGVMSPIRGYKVLRGYLGIELHGPELKNATIKDNMSIIALRRMALINKMFKNPGRLSHYEGHPNIIISDEYPGELRISAVFDPPYLNEGDPASVSIEYELVDAFEKKDYWDYKIEAEVDFLSLELSAPSNVRLRVEGVESYPPMETISKTLQPSIKNETTHWHFDIDSPKVDATYRLRWAKK